MGPPGGAGRYRLSSLIFSQQIKFKLIPEKQDAVESPSASGQRDSTKG